jgi:hypothetical protein
VKAAAACKHAREFVGVDSDMEAQLSEAVVAPVARVNVNNQVAVC